MKICQIFHRDYPWDVRVEKICRSLIKAGHEVHLICNNTEGLANQELCDGIHIHRLPTFKKKKVNKLISFPAFFNLFWILHIYRLTKQHRFDVILVRDLPLVLAAWFVSKHFRVPLVYDMAENFPAMLRNFTAPFKSPFLATILENISLKIIDHLIVVVEESRDRVVNKGLNPLKVTIVSNTPELDIFRKNVLTHENRILENNRINLLYIGYIVQLRGLDVVIKAFPLLQENYNNITFTIVGDGIYLQELKKLVSKMKLDKDIRFTGWVDFKYIPSIISQCDIGVIPHYANDHTDSTIPNKLFDYMAFAKPVIVSDAKPLERMVLDTGCGAVFRSGSHKDFAHKLQKLNNDTQKAEIGKKGQVAVKEIYNWDRDSARLNSVFERLRS
jgi:glycosyltransferase involved in cell wall biosynthesis